MFTGNEWKGILSPSIDGINVRQAEMVCVDRGASIPLKRIHGTAGNHPAERRPMKKSCISKGRILHAPTTTAPWTCPTTTR